MLVFAVGNENKVVHFLSSFHAVGRGGIEMARWNEPGYINFERRNGGDRVLEAVGVAPVPGGRSYVMVCGMGKETVWIRWYGRSVDEARSTFRDWLAKPWQVLTTDFAGSGIPNGMDFKTNKIDWFNISGE
jgi:hypothetical protein